MPPSQARGPLRKILSSMSSLCWERVSLIVYTTRLLEHATALGEFYTGSFVLQNFIEPVTLACLNCIRRNITLGGYLDSRI